jgi:hypothetical protein
MFAVFSGWVSSLGSVTELTCSVLHICELFIFQQGLLFFERFLWRSFFAHTF